MEVSVVIPTHMGRSSDLLNRAVNSVLNQTHWAMEIIISVDIYGKGAGDTRQRGLERSGSPLTAFLDSDDEFKPEHLAVLHDVMVPDPNIIMAFSWFDAVGMPDPLGHFGLPFDPTHPHHTTVTTMVRTDVALGVGGFPREGEGGTTQCLNDDWIFLLRMCQHAVEFNKKIVHVPQRTWRYHNHGRNTSGRVSQGDAAP